MPGYARPTNIIPATSMVFNPSGNISSTDVQNAIVELDSEKEKYIPLQSSAPSSPSTSDLWIDNSVATAPKLKVYNGSSWVIVAVLVEDDQEIISSQVFR